MNEASLTSILRKLGIHEFKRQRSGWIDFHCPLAPWTHRSGTDRSMSAGAKIVDDGISAWVCHACKHHGRIPNLVVTLQRFRGESVPGLLHEAEMADVTPSLVAEYGEFERPVERPPEPLREAMVDGLYPLAETDDEAAAYLAGRGISFATSTKLGLLYDPEQRRILFPIRDGQNRLWGFSGRALDKTAKPKVRDYYGLPKRRLILGEHRWEAGKPLLLVEGLFGYAHLTEVGADRLCNVGAILGSVLTEEKAEIVKWWDENTYLLLDNDEGGDLGLFGPLLPDGTRDTASGAVGRLAGYVPVYVPEWPEGKDDPDQLTLDEVQTIVSTTPPYADFLS